MRTLIMSTCVLLHACSAGIPQTNGSDTNIFGGTPANMSLPEGYATVALAQGGGRGRGGAMASCTGTIIHPRLVISAKHCGGSPQGTSIFLGSDISRGGQQDFVQIAKVVKHQRSDIELIILASDIPAGTKQPVPILPAGMELTTSDTIIEAGFGNTGGRAPRFTGGGSLLRTEVTFARMNTGSRGGFAGPFATLRSSNGKGACHGDSGGPAFVVRNGVWYLFGATSGGEERCGNEDVDYSFVPAHVDWIRQTAASSGVNFDPGSATQPPPPTPYPTPYPTAYPTPLPPPPPTPVPVTEPVDIAAHPLAAEIRQAITRGLIRTYRDNSFRPDVAITRLETALLLQKMVQHTQAASAHPLPASVTTAPYPDVTTTDPFAPVLAFISQKGLISPFADGTFRSNESISRGYFLAGLYKTLKLVLETLNLPSPASLAQNPRTFTNVPAGHWTEAYAKALSGFCNAAFATQGELLEIDTSATRAYAAAAASRAFTCLAERAPTSGAR